jgi:hypothetical protein
MDSFSAKPVNWQHLIEIRSNKELDEDAPAVGVTVTFSDFHLLFQGK